MKRKKGLRGIESNGKAATSKRSVRPSRIFIYALALAALGGGGYLVYDHFRRKKLTSQNNSEIVDTVTTGESINTNTAYTSNAASTASKKKSTARTTTASDDFPLKKGSKGPRVVQLQQALISKGASIAADGIFGPATLSALKAQGYSNTIDETAFTKLTGSEPVLKIVFNPADLAKKLLSATNRNNADDVVYILRQIKTVNEYTAVNEQYKKLLLISKTIVTHLLDYAFKDDEAARELIKVEFFRIGLKVNEAGIWSLQGIQLYKDLITIRPTIVIDAWNNRLPVKGNTILGDEVKIENGMTWFRSVDRTILKVPTQDVKYA
ncbi:peptidoglycan-binding protein [Ohtaekwangia kribbensis]|uniref:Peptidoglycan-binding protein n=1 Tax=Ohtaekwangia kribbensis TaxID=688913 RepID=A0ABW3JXY9_9BACT